MIKIQNPEDLVHDMVRKINALNRSKPFRNFKWQIDNSGDYRQVWFDFKRRRYKEFVKKQIEEFKSLEEWKKNEK